MQAWCAVIPAGPKLGPAESACGLQVRFFAEGSPDGRKGGGKGRKGGGKGGGGKGGGKGRGGGKGGAPENLITYSSSVTEEDKKYFPTEADFVMKPLKPAKTRPSDLKTELLRGMDEEDKKLVLDIAIPHNPANPLIQRDAFINSETIMARRVNKVTKGGRTEKFSLLVAVGDGKGLLGIGQAKGISFFDARSRAVRRAMRSMFYVDRFEDRTVFHEMEAKTQASKVIIMPAPEGHGVRANATAGALCRMAGIRDIMVKTHGTPNPMAIVAAFQKALEGHNSAEMVALKRGMKVHDVRKAQESSVRR